MWAFDPLLYLLHQLSGFVLLIFPSQVFALPCNHHVDAKNTRGSESQDSDAETQNLVAQEGRAGKLESEFLPGAKPTGTELLTLCPAP